MQATEANKAVIEQMKAAAAAPLCLREGAGRGFGRQARSARAELYPQVGRSRPSVRLGHLGRHRRASWQRRASRSIAARSSLGDPLKSLGDFKVAIRLHREVTARVTVKVQAEASEEETSRSRGARRCRTGR